jgi:Cu-Zn family superoxide dismutase
MNRSTVTTAAATAGLLASAALGLAAPAVADVIRASGEVTRYPNQVITGDKALEGATARVQSVETGDGKTIVTLNVAGMESFGEYGAHAHNGPCGDPAADKDPLGLVAGGHYQQDPAGKHGKPATDPAYANPANEIWLDFATNHAGEGRSKSVVDWQFTDARRPRSVIIHEKYTSPENGKAGARVACIDVSF